MSSSRELASLFGVGSLLLLRTVKRMKRVSVIVLRYNPENKEGTTIESNAIIENVRLCLPPQRPLSKYAS